MPLPPGARLGSYEVLALLGAGGMGEVYAARDVDLRRRVALKVLPEAVAADRLRLARFEREAQLASSLNHPNIVTIHGIGRDAGVTYIAMELIDGETLRSAVQSSGWPIERIIDAAVQIAGGLAKAHDAGVVHRDLKPQNVMVTRDGLVKVLDFGLGTLAPAAALGDATTVEDAPLTSPGAVLGTVHYMSPEQASGRQADFRSDQFSFGAVLYELLAGRRPFEAPTAVQVLSAIIASAPTPLADLNPRVPERLRAIVDRCLAKQPEGRYASTRDLVRDLEAARGDFSVPPATPRAGARRRAVAWAAGAVLVAAAALAVPSVRDRLRSPFGPDAPAHQQIAVLPFANVGSDPAAQPFVDGLVEVLTTQLTQIARFDAALEVVPASDVRTERVTSPREARQAFHVSRAITGSVQDFAGAARVTINLVDAERGRNIDARSIELKDRDAGSMQDRVVREVAAMIGATLPAGTQRAWATGGTDVPAAYEAFVQARGYLQRYERLESIDAAIEALTRALQRDPNYGLAHAALAEAYWRKYDPTKDARWVVAARASAATAVGLADRLAPVHVTLGMIHAGTGQPEEGIRELRRAISLDPLDADAYRELANVYQALGRNADAEATYKLAIEVRPLYWANYNALGAFYMTRVARYADAEAAIKRAIALSPENTRAHNNLGALYLHTGRYDEAAVVLEKSIAIKPNAVAYSNLGTGYFYLGRYADAARQMEKAIAFGRSNSQLLKNLASSYLKVPAERGKAEETFRGALAATEAELAVNPRDAALLLRAADCLAELKQPAAARARLEEALRTTPDDVRVQAGAGIVYETLGDRARAIELIRSALAHGYSRDLIDRSPDLAALRADPRFTRQP